MKYPVRIGDQTITLEHDDFDNHINVDAMTTIDTGNLFGEAVTISAVANRIGMLKSACESNMNSSKLELKIFEGRFRSKLRKEASKNAGFYTTDVDGEAVKVKITEKGLETAHQDSPEWIRLSKQFIEDERAFNNLSSLLWSIQDKARKLNTLVSGTTPHEFINGLVEGKINGILIKKAGGSFGGLG